MNPNHHHPTLAVTLAIALTLQATLPNAQAAERASTPATTPATAASAPPQRQTAKPTPLQGDAKLLLVLDRFTYGPRPGDLEHLRQIGLQAWFNQQLNPQSIDDSALDIRLADYPAMQLSLPELMRQYPDQPMVRKVLNGNASIPPGPAEQAIYNNQIARLDAKLDNKKQPAQPQNQAQPQSETQPQTPSVHLPFTASEALAMPPTQRFNAICRLSPEQQKALRESLPPADRPRLTQGFSPLQLEQFAALERPAAVVAAEAVQTKLLRDIYSERQLNEIMTDFWLNHFNVYLRKNQFAPYYIATYARDTIRPRALGNFENLLIATAVSPAMLSYLDNASSVGPDSPFAKRPNARQGKKPDIGLNENYARELMELHTLGVDGGYTQHDVTEVAKVFTGWTLGDPAPPRGPFGQPRGPGLPILSEFDITKHQPGPKLVLGHTIQPAGEREGLEVLHLLATSPSTARFISTKLAVRFVSDNPPPAMIDRMAKTFLATNGNIRQVLIAMVNSPEFFTSTTQHAKVKTPVDFVVSAVRASGAEVESAGALADVIANLGMPIYGMQTPNGYSMKADPWNNTASLVARLNFALALSTNRVVGVTTHWDTLLSQANAPATTATTTPATMAATYQPASQPNYKLTSQLTSQPTNQPAAQLPDEALDQSIAQVVNDPAEPAGAAPQQSQTNRTASATGPSAPNRPTTNQTSGFDPNRLPANMKEALLEAMLLHETPSERTHQAILAQITADPAQQQASLRQVAIENRSRDPLAIYRTPPLNPNTTQPPIPAGSPRTPSQPQAAAAPGTQPNTMPPQSNALSANGNPHPLDLQAALAAGLLFGSPEFQRR